MSVDIKSLNIPPMLLGRMGIYGAAQVDIPFIYVVHETYSHTFPYRCLLYPQKHYEYCEDWDQKGLAKEVGVLFDAYSLNIDTIMFYNCYFPSLFYDKLTDDEERKFKKNVKKVVRWHKNKLLHYKYPNVEDMLED